jgi:DNA-binding response OmpR family regulator
MKSVRIEFDTLPLARRAHAVHNRLVQPALSTGPPRDLVLIIDEDETARDLYAYWFMDRGFDVMHAVGITGLAWALRSERPRLIVTELSARELSIQKLFRRLSSDELTRCIPVIVVTTCTDPVAHQSAKNRGAVIVLPKFGEFELLDTWVHALCDRPAGPP